MNRIEAADNFIAGLGYEAYRVGGSVRDEIIGRRPKDTDYMVRGVPMFDLGQALVRAGAKVSPIRDRNDVQIGWRAAKQGIGVAEVVLPRVEENAGPGRQQKIVVDPAISLTQDAQRRDFTFNALYRAVPPQHVNGWGDTPYGDMGIVDPTRTGVYDLTHRIIRTTHPDSFRDDPLRILRALRFVSTLSADLSDDTLEQMRDHADRVDGMTKVYEHEARSHVETMDGGHTIVRKRMPGDSQEAFTVTATSGTVLDELRKLLMGQCPAKALRIARDAGVLAVAIPELSPMLGFNQGSRYHDMTTDEHTFKALETAAHVDAPLRVRMALLFHDSGKPECAWVGKDGRKHYYAPDDATWSWVCLADGTVHQSTTSYPPKPEDHEVAGERIWRTFAGRVNAEKSLRDEVATLIREHMVPTQKVNRVKVRRARVRLGDALLRDLYLMRMCDLSGKGAKNEKFMVNIGGMEQARVDAVRAGVPSSVGELAIGGRDAMELGIDGRKIGEALRAVLDEVVVRADERAMDREWQLARLSAVGR